MVQQIPIIEKIAVQEEYPAWLMTRINAAGGAFDWLNDPAEDIYCEALPPHLQDAIDRFLIDEVRGEQEEAVDWTI